LRRGLSGACALVLPEHVRTLALLTRLPLADKVRGGADAFASPKGDPAFHARE
jgi:hypothetical protein